MAGGDHKVGITIILRDKASKAISDMAKSASTLEGSVTSATKKVEESFSSAGTAVKKVSKGMQKDLSNVGVAAAKTADVYSRSSVRIIKANADVSASASSVKAAQEKVRSSTVAAATAAATAAAKTVASNDKILSSAKTTSDAVSINFVKMVADAKTLDAAVDDVEFPDWGSYTKSASDAVSTNFSKIRKDHEDLVSSTAAAKFPDWPDTSTKINEVSDSLTALSKQKVHVGAFTGLDPGWLNKVDTELSKVGKTSDSVKEQYATMRAAVGSAGGGWLAVSAGTSAAKAELEAIAVSMQGNEAALEHHNKEVRNAVKVLDELSSTKGLDITRDTEKAVEALARIEHDGEDVVKTFSKIMDSSMSNAQAQEVLQASMKRTADGLRHVETSASDVEANWPKFTVEVPKALQNIPKSLEKGARFAGRYNKAVQVLTERVRELGSNAITSGLIKLEDRFNRLRASIDKAKKKARDLGAAFLKLTKGNGKKILQWVKRFALAITALAATVVFIIKKTAQFGDQLAKTAPRVGVTAQEFQKLDYAMRISGTSMQVHRGSLTKFARTARDATTGVQLAADAFSTLGVSIEKNSVVAGKNQAVFKRTYDLLLDVADGFKHKLSDGIQKSAGGMDLFGRSGAQLLQFLNLGSKGIRELADRFEMLGGVMDDRALALSSMFIDSLNDLKTALGGVVRLLTVEFMGSLGEAMKVTAEQMGKSHDKIAQIIPSLKIIFKFSVQFFGIAIKTLGYITQMILWVSAGIEMVLSFIASLVSGILTGIGHAISYIGVGLVAAVKTWVTLFTGGLSAGVDDLVGYFQDKIGGVIGWVGDRWKEAQKFFGIEVKTEGLDAMSKGWKDMAKGNEESAAKIKKDTDKAQKEIAENTKKNFASVDSFFKGGYDFAGSMAMNGLEASSTMTATREAGVFLREAVDLVTGTIIEYTDKVTVASGETDDLGDAGMNAADRMKRFEYQLLKNASATREFAAEGTSVPRIWQDWDTAMTKNGKTLDAYTDKLELLAKDAKIAGYAGGKAMKDVLERAVDLKLITDDMAFEIYMNPNMFESAMDKVVGAAKDAVSEINKEFDKMGDKLKETEDKIRMYLGDPFEYGSTKAVDYFRKQESLGEKEVESRADLAKQKTELFRKVAAGEMDALEAGTEYSKASRDLEASILKDRENANKNFWRGIRDNIIDTVLTETIQKGVSVAAAWWESSEKIKADAAQLAVKTSNAIIESGLTKGATVDSVLSNKLVLSDTLATEGGKQTAKGTTFGLSKIGTALQLTTDLSADQAALASKITTETAMTTVDAAGTAAEVAGVGVATTAVVTGEGTKLAARETTTIASVMMYIAESIGAVFAAIAAIPIIGPFIAPAAAIGAGVWLGGKTLGAWADGGMVTGGDMVTGGQKGKDSVLGMLMPGEFVMTTKQVGMMQKLVGSMENTPTPMKFANGGFVTGGTPGRDSVPALLTPGELVLSVSDVEDWKRLSGALSRSGPSDNNYAEGGVVRRPAQPVAQTVNNDTNINLEFKSNQLPNRAETKRWIKSTLQPALKELGQQGMLSTSGI